MLLAAPGCTSTPQKVYFLRHNISPDRAWFDEYLFTVFNIPKLSLLTSKTPLQAILSPCYSRVHFHARVSA